MPTPVPPVPIGEELENDAWSQFFETLRRLVNTPTMYSSTTDPGTANVPAGTWSVWKNTTSGVVKLWANDGGVMKSVTIT